MNHDDFEARAKNWFSTIGTGLLAFFILAVIAMLVIKALGMIGGALF